ncbi:MAG: HAD family hydrolase [Candidatus Methanomethylophilaceae archaeon]|nr:HAD family hydrolase [Candidatus Methanomethylophilaceae archaeon]
MSGRRCVFIDRDDTIAKDVPYCDSPDKFHLFPGVPGQIKRLNDAGFLVIMITNQSGIGRGYFTEDTLRKIHDKMNSEIEAGGGHLDAIYYCPHRPDENCPCRKPKTLMGERAVKDFDIDVSESFMVGDSDADMAFGKSLGCRTVRVSSDFTFADAVDRILEG